MPLVFQYSIEFPQFANPPGRKVVVEESIRQFLMRSDYDFMMGPHGGGFRTYGDVGRKDRDAVPSDRECVLEWLVKQPIYGVIRIGPLEEADKIQILSDNWLTSVSVDNLTEVDRAEATAYAEKIVKFIQQKLKPHDAAAVLENISKRIEQRWKPNRE